VEAVEGAGEKSKAVLRGIPGWHLFKDLATIDAAATPFRGFYSGAGRCFVAAGTKYFEIDSTGALVGSVRTIADDASHSPVQIIPNANQLLIISAGMVYCDNGSGPVAVTIPALAGVVNTDLLSVSWLSGDKFDAEMAGQSVTINAVAYTVNQVISPTLLTLTSSAGVQIAVAYSAAPAFRASSGAFIDGYFVVSRPNSRQFNISPLLNGLGPWDQLDFAIKEDWPDKIVRVYSDNELLAVFGTETTAFYRNTGAASFPFERVGGGVVSVGLAACWSVVSIMGRLYFLGSTHGGQVIAYRMDGSSPTRVSTHAVEYSMMNGNQPSSAVAFSYEDQGHWFWVINLNGGPTWVYDVTTQEWHERKHWKIPNLVFDAYRFWYHTFIPEWGISGKHLVGDFLTGKVYEMSSSFYDADGNDIRVQRTMGPIYSEGKRIFHHRIEIENEAGLVSSGGTPPVMELDWSDDRGHTFGTGAGGAGTKQVLSTGAAGAYSTRAYAVALGSSRGRNYRLTITGQAKVAIIDAALEATEGAI
jgi:hypothetical protein